ncbi:Hint domain-containing protein [Actinokineospora diospyrosa]|nr:Hint domain-containing protein [Actinokineospora diospyrosa]
MTVPAEVGVDGDTKVLLGDGTEKPIRDIRPGEKVLAADPETGEQSARDVIATWPHKDTVQQLVLADGSTIDTTAGHPFWNLTEGEWLPAKALHLGDLLLDSSGSPAAVVGLREGYSRSVEVFNLTVDTAHTFFVVAGETAVLVHNRCGDDPNLPGIAKSNYRGRFIATMRNGGFQDLPNDWDAHHAIPQEYRNHPEFVDFDFDAPSNIRGIPGGRMKSRGANVHQDITLQWKYFKETNPNATRAQIEAYAAQIDRGYSAYFWAEPK